MLDQQLVVELSVLREQVLRLRASKELALAPGLATAHGLLFRASLPNQHASGEIRAAEVALADALAACGNNRSAFLARTTRLAEAIDFVIAGYVAADQTIEAVLLPRLGLSGMDPGTIKALAAMPMPTVPEVGPFSYGEAPPQRSYPAAFVADWNAYDVPRIRDTVFSVDLKALNDQVDGFRRLDHLLVEQYRQMRRHRDAISAAWSGVAADGFLYQLDEVSRAMLADAYCANSTARGLANIYETYKKAQDMVTRLNDNWGLVTLGPVPDDWLLGAKILNGKARDLMVASDQAVHDWRTKITVPEWLPPSRDDSPQLVGTATAAEIRLTGPVGYVPSVPGLSPVSQVTGPDLAGLPPMLPAVPGQPVSMLPIAPGSVYAPFGGAYVLPGPGVGAGGVVVPMPHAGYRSGGAAPYLPGAAGMGGTGLMPMPMGGMPMTGAGASGGALAVNRRADTVWPMRPGVPPVITGLDNDEFIPGRPSQQHVEKFESWFTDLSTPWRQNPTTVAEGEPKVTFRMNPS